MSLEIPLARSISNKRMPAIRTSFARRRGTGQRHMMPDERGPIASIQPAIFLWCEGPEQCVPDMPLNLSNGVFHIAAGDAVEDQQVVIHDLLQQACVHA